MAKIQLRHIGPIKDTGILTLTQVMLIIGRQSSGKSTFMKVLCFCRWLEKLIMVSEENIVSLYTHNQKFLKDLKQFYRFNDAFFSPESYIHYEGDVVTIDLNGTERNIKIQLNPKFDELKYNTKLSFIPSERNLISAIKNIDQSYRSSGNDVLFNYIFEWGEAKDGYTSNHPKQLSFTDRMEYVNDNGTDSVRINGKHPMPVFYASSGVQSAIPLDVMTDHFTRLVGTIASISKHDLSSALLKFMDKQGELTSDIIASVIKRRNIYQSVQLFVEEPEQNLYPESQRKLLLSMIAALKRALPHGEKESMMVLTTHSPYILSVLNVLIAWAVAMEQNPDNEALKSVLHEDYFLPSSAYSAYYIQDNGIFTNVMYKDDDITMISGNELDGVSDWIDARIAEINAILYNPKEHL